MKAWQNVSADDFIFDRRDFEQKYQQREQQESIQKK